MSGATNYVSSESSDESSSENSLSIKSPMLTKSNQKHSRMTDEYEDGDSPIIKPLRPYTQQDLSSIFVLPPEILILIFSFFKEKSDLVSLLPVCKYWAQLLIELIWFRPKLQSKKAFKQIQTVLDTDPNATFLNYHSFIRRLNLCFISNYVEDEFLLKFQNLSNLERLTLVNCNKLSSSAIAQILKNCSKLQSIDMSGVKNISSEIFDALAENSPRLQGVYAPDAGNVSNESIINLFKHCPFLKRIKLTKSDNINDLAIDELSKNFKYVVEIDLHGCPNVTDSSLIKVFHNLEQLREFRISQNKNVSDNIFKSLPDIQFLNRLRIIDFTDCLYITDRSIEKIVQCAPRLRNVVLSKCLNITDASLRALATLNKSLHYIHLGHCSNITDFGVKLLVSSCYRLQYIDLACCTQLTNASVVELANLPRLKRIGLVKCIHITDQGIVELVEKRGPGDTLERVHLSYCTQLSTHPIYLLLQSCPKLTHLSLTGISSFLRPDFKRFCRDPPEEFTAHQRSLFCVFSGNGVKKLRDHLSSIYPSEENINMQTSRTMFSNQQGRPVIIPQTRQQMQHFQHIQQQALLDHQRRLFSNNNSNSNNNDASVTSTGAPVTGGISNDNANNQLNTLSTGAANNGVSSVSEQSQILQNLFRNSPQGSNFEINNNEVQLSLEQQQQRQLQQQLQLQQQQQLQSQPQEQQRGQILTGGYWPANVNSNNGGDSLNFGPAVDSGRAGVGHNFQWNNAFTQTSTPVPESFIPGNLENFRNGTSTADVNMTNSNNNNNSTPLNPNDDISMSEDVD